MKKVNDILNRISEGEEDLILAKPDRKNVIKIHEKNHLDFILKYVGKVLKDSKEEENELKHICTLKN